MIIFLNLPCHIIMSKCHPNPRDLDKILPTGLQNCPRAYGPWAVLEALGQDFIQNPSGLGWHFLPEMHMRCASAKVSSLSRMH